MTYYLFTDERGEKIDLKDFDVRGQTHDDEGKLTNGAPSSQALAHRKTLQKKANAQVISWVQVGGQEVEPLA